jgi:putative ABC transport system permease protein
VTALLSVAVVATIATAALTVYRDLESKVSREFSGFGANVIVSKRQGAVDQQQVAEMQRLLVQKDPLLAGKVRIVPVAYAIASTQYGSKVVVGGTDVDDFRELNSSWSMREAGNPHTQVMLGSRAAQALSPNGTEFTISFGPRQAKLKPEIIFSSGSDDDSRIYVDLKEFTALTGVAPQTAFVRVAGRPRDIQDAIAALSSSFRELEVKPIRQITQTQTSVVGKTRSLFLAACAVVVLLIMLCMVATLTSAVLERRKDFAVMKALGAPNRTVSLLFAGEAAVLALAGAVVGFAAGSVIAYWIGKANFDAAILPEPGLLLPVLTGSVMLALLAATLPLRLLRRIQPAGILRGE